MVTVTDLLEVERLALRPLHLPSPDTAVRWVATSELADPTPYLEGGEVLLTTGLDTAAWADEWDDYVGRLAEARVAALGLGIGLTHKQAPPALLAACQQHQLNLVEVPPETTFVGISRAAARLLEEAEEAAARQALDMQRELTQAAVRLDDTTSFVRRLGTLVAGAAATLSRDGEVVAGPSGPLADVLDLDALREEVATLRPQGLRAASSLSARSGTTVLRPIGLRARPEAYLAVLVPGRPSDAVRAAVNTAVSLMSLAVESRIDRRATERGLRARAIELLLADDPHTAGVVLGSTSLGGRLPRRVRVLRARGGREPLEDAVGLLEADDLLCALTGDGLVAVAPAARAEHVSDVLVGAGLQVGVGRAVTPDEASASGQTAGHALAETTAAVPIRRWDDIVGAGVLGLVPADRGAAFASSFLAPLEGNEELLATLQSFLRHHGSRGAVAEELGVHRNTVRNRVEQIESLLDRSLDDPQARVDCWVALQIATLQV